MGALSGWAYKPPVVIGSGQESLTGSLEEWASATAPLQTGQGRASLRTAQALGDGHDDPSTMGTGLEPQPGPFHHQGQGCSVPSPFLSVWNLAVSVGGWSLW